MGVLFYSNIGIFLSVLTLHGKIKKSPSEYVKKIYPLAKKNFSALFGIGWLTSIHMDLLWNICTCRHWKHDRYKAGCSKNRVSTVLEFLVEHLTTFRNLLYFLLLMKKNAQKSRFGHWISTSKTSLISPKKKRFWCQHT